MPCRIPPASVCQAGSTAWQWTSGATLIETLFLEYATLDVLPTSPIVHITQVFPRCSQPTVPSPGVRDRRMRPQFRPPHRAGTSEYTPEPKRLVDGGGIRRPKSARTNSRPGTNEPSHPATKRTQPPPCRRSASRNSALPNPVSAASGPADARTFEPERRRGRASKQTRAPRPPRQWRIAEGTRAHPSNAAPVRHGCLQAGRARLMHNYSITGTDLCPNCWLKPAEGRLAY